MDMFRYTKRVDYVQKNFDAFQQRKSNAQTKRVLFTEIIDYDGSKVSPKSLWYIVKYVTSNFLSEDTFESDRIPIIPRTRNKFRRFRVDFAKLAAIFYEKQWKINRTRWKRQTIKCSSLCSP